MILIGALLAATAAGAALLAAVPMSGVARRLELFAPRDGARAGRRQPREADLRHAGVPLDADRFLALRAACALALGLLVTAMSVFVAVGPLIVALAAYAGFVAPALIVSQRATAERRAADAAVAILVERLEALVAAGRPPEAALARLMSRPTGSAILDGVLRRAAAAYALGAASFRSLAAHAREEGIESCATLADELERSRDLGTASLTALRELRTSLRAAQRSRSLAAASQVEGKLMLVLVLCYLPALMLLVVVPLFIGLLEGLFA